MLETNAPFYTTNRFKQYTGIILISLTVVVLINSKLINIPVQCIWRIYHYL